MRFLAVINYVSKLTFHLIGTATTLPRFSWKIHEVKLSTGDQSFGKLSYIFMDTSLVLIIWLTNGAEDPTCIHSTYIVLNCFKSFCWKMGIRLDYSYILVLLMNYELWKVKYLNYFNIYLYYNLYLFRSAWIAYKCVRPTFGSPNL